MQINAAREKELIDALREGRRAIGDHYAPDDCYATGPLTGNAWRDLIQCPACSFIAIYDAVIVQGRRSLTQPNKRGITP